MKKEIRNWLKKHHKLTIILGIIITVFTLYVGSASFLEAVLLCNQYYDTTKYEIFFDGMFCMFCVDMAVILIDCALDLIIRFAKLIKTFIESKKASE